MIVFSKYFLFLNSFFCCLLLGCQSLDTNLAKLKSPNAKDRSEAIYWLVCNVQSDNNAKLLEDAIQKDDSELVRSLAARLLSLSGEKNCIPLLEKALQDSSMLVRMEAIQGLGTLQAHQSMEHLIGLLSKEPELWVRLKILKTIEYWNVPPALSVLIERLDDHEPAVRFQSLALLEKFTGKKIGMDKEGWQKWYRSDLNGYQ